MTTATTVQCNTTFITHPTLTTKSPITFNPRSNLSFKSNNNINIKNSNSDRRRRNNNNYYSVRASLGDSSNSNYVVPFDITSSCITRPLAEILRDLNKRINDNIIVKTSSDTSQSASIPWYHANRMLSFYAPGWCGEIRDVIFSDTGSVTVVYRVTVRGSDGEAHRESTGTVSSTTNDQNVDPVAAAEEIAFCKACARFGLGLYLYHED